MTFTKDEECFILGQFAINKSPTAVRRAFVRQFKDTRTTREFQTLKPHHFRRVYDRFQANGIANAPNSEHERGVDKTDPAKVELIRDHFIQNPMNSIHTASNILNIPEATIRRILRKIGFFPYKMSLAQVLTEAQKQARLKFCQWLLEQPDEIIFQIIFRDEKWFQLNQHPNRQNVRFWAPSMPDNEDILLDIKSQSVKKIMAFVIVVDGQCVLYWHEEEGKPVPVNTDRYLLAVSEVLSELPLGPLKTRYWWQQDGASCHTSKKSMAKLREIFGERIISRFANVTWPAHSPDLNPLDFSFWGQAMSKVWEAKPQTINELKVVVENFFSNLSKDYTNKCVFNIKKRAQLCINQNGGHFEHLL